MKIVIDISDELYRILKRNEADIRCNRDALKLAVIDGTVLPIGHGDLIDRDNLLVHKECKYRGECRGNEDDCDRCSCFDNGVDVRADIESAPVIIEADKGEE